MMPTYSERVNPCGCRGVPNEVHLPGCRVKQEQEQAAQRQMRSAVLELARRAEDAQRDQDLAERDGHVIAAVKADARRGAYEVALDVVRRRLGTRVEHHTHKGRDRDDTPDQFSECDGDCYLCSSHKCRRNP